MRSFFPGSYFLLVSTLALSVLGSSLALSKGSDDLQESIGTLDEPKYTVNFNQVSAAEVIRFISKITRTNFVFEESDLQFKVTIISEEAISVKNILSALVQILRIHDLRLLEQDGSFIITKNPAVNQIPTIVSHELSNSKETNSPLITRVFRIKNTSPASIGAIIKPMLSLTSLVEPVEETQQLIVTDTTTNIEKISSLLVSLDSPNTRLEIDSYIVKYISPTDLIELTKQILSPFAAKNPLIFVPQPDTNTVFIVSTPYLVERALTVMEDLDIQPKQVVIGSKLPEQNDVHIYKIINQDAVDLISNLAEIATQVEKLNPGVPSPFAHTIRQAKYIADTNSLVFVTDAATWTKLQEVLPSLDTLGSDTSQKFFVYKILHSSEEQLRLALMNMAKSLDDKGLLETIKKGSWIKETNSLLFNGAADSIAKLQNILPTLDSEEAGSRGEFLLYTPKNQTGSNLELHLKDLTDNLKRSGLMNPSLLSTLESMRWTSSTNSLLFTGDATSLAKVQELLNGLDTVETSSPTQVFVYKPIFAKQEQLKVSLDRFAQGLSTGNISDQKLAEAIKHVQWIEESSSFVFKADTDTITRIKEILGNLDSVKGVSGAYSSTFFLYKLQNAQGSSIIENLKNLTENISSQDPRNESIIKTIRGLKWVKENNSLLITGTPYAIDEVKQLIAEFDIPSNSSNSGVKTEFFIYKPVVQTPAFLEKAISDFAKDLEISGLSDPDLLYSLKSARYVDATQSLLFTGTPDALAKIRQFIQTLDSSSHLTPLTVGNTTFLIYKIQHLKSDELMNSIRSFSSQVHAQDPALASVLNSARWIQETNSLLFTGSEEMLFKVEKLMEKFDIASTSNARISTPTFVVYNPKYQSGASLIGILTEFMQGLMNSGVSDPSLFDAIKHLKFIEKTNSLIISGEQSSINKIQELLEKFDTLSQNDADQIATIDNADFLIYKLQYHKGLEIQMALKKVGLSLLKLDPIANKQLTECIESLQWIEVTNSLLGTGEPETLTKVKSLIQSLDVPLKQVFIEVLVIETTLANSQTFGLQWGSQLQYLNRTIGAMGNFPQSPNNILQLPLTNTTSGSPPVQGGTSTNSVPFTSGFDLGVIGDIIFHKGQSFLSLGSLVNALQIDSDATIVMNPKIMTQDGKTSTIFVGQNIPFVGSFVSNTSNNTTETSNIEYRDVGFNLIVTPTLGNNNVITLDINQDISQQVQSTTSFSGGEVTGIQTSHATMTTRVHVPDRHFLVLSGMIQDEKDHTRTGLPCLGGLPMIGAMFSNSTVKNAKLNVIIFMKPYIIRSFEDMDVITAGEEKLFKDQCSLPDIREIIDGGTEMIKSIEDD